MCNPQPLENYMRKRQLNGRPTPKLYTLEISGRPTVVITVDIDVGDNCTPIMRHTAAMKDIDQSLDIYLGEILCDSWNADTRLPLWDGDKSKLSTRPATSDEIVVWEVGFRNALMAGDASVAYCHWAEYLVRAIEVCPWATLH